MNITEQLIELNKVKADIRSSIEESGVEISDTDTFASYAPKTTEILENADIVLFNTKDEMEAAEGKEGQYALCYSNSFGPIGANDTFSTVTFPVAVTLPEAVTSTTYSYLAAVDTSQTISASVSLTTSSFRFTFMNMSAGSYYSVTYASSDATTYTLSTYAEDYEIDLGTEVYFSTLDNENILSFMWSGSILYDGPYEKSKENLDWEMLDLGLTAEPSDVYLGKKYQGSTGIGMGTLGSSVSSDFDDASAEIYVNTIESYSSSTTPIVISASSNAYIFPINSSGEPLVTLDNTIVSSTTLSVPNLRLIQGLEVPFGYTFQSSGITSANVKLVGSSCSTTTGSLFRFCSSLSDINLTSDIGACLSTSYMFQSCLSLSNLDLSNLDTSAVTTMNGMFYGCKYLTSLDMSTWDTSNVTSMQYLFNSCSSITSLDLTNFNTSKVTIMGDMFESCNSLTSLDLSSFDTSNVTNMDEMFQSCESLTSLDLSSFDTPNLTTVQYMFRGCTALQSINLSGFNTSSVEKMTYMFTNCYALSSLDLSSFNTSSTTSMSGMFYNCTSLTTLDLSNFDTSSVTTMSTMFRGCTSLETLDLSGWTKLASTTSQMFTDCENLTCKVSSSLLSKFNALGYDSSVVTFVTEWPEE